MITVMTLTPVYVDHNIVSLFIRIDSILCRAYMKLMGCWFRICPTVAACPVLLAQGLAQGLPIVKLHAVYHGVMTLLWGFAGSSLRYAEHPTRHASALCYAFEVRSCFLFPPVVQDTPN